MLELQANTIEQFIVYVHQNEAHFTYIYVYHTNVFQADNIYKNPPPNVISPIFFLFRSGAPPKTLLTAETLTDPQLPAIASNVCTIDAWLGGVGWRNFFLRSGNFQLSALAGLG